MSTSSVGADALLGLLEQLRGASRLGRAKILAQAVKALRALPGPERKVLAVEVARQVAPKLVPALEASDGELSASQISEFVSMVQQLESDQIAAIATAVRAGDTTDPAVRELMDQVATTALDALAPPPPDETTASARFAEEPTDEPAEEPTDELAEEDRTPDETTASARFAAEPTDEPAEEDRTPDETTASARFAEEPTGEAERARWEVEAAAELEAEVEARRAQVTAAPDGWRRRRLLLDLAREDLIADDEAVGLVALLERHSDRAWVVGMLVDRGLVVLDEAASLLEPRAVHRLRERMAA